MSNLHRTIVRVDRVCYNHLLLIICGWSPYIRVSRPLDVFGDASILLEDGDHVIAKVNVGAEKEEDLVFEFEYICPRLEDSVLEFN